MKFILPLKYGGEHDMKYVIDTIIYNHWANLQLADAATDLDKKQFYKVLISSFPSVHKTLIHILWAEELWVERWQGRSFIPALDPEDYPTLESIKEKIESLYQDQIQYLNNLNPESEDQYVSYINFRGEKWDYTLRQMVQHLTFHSAFHRGQLVTLLRQLGVNPPNTDYLMFIDYQSD
jgi:uncharacterized damage-inducible protein DinB